MSKVPPMTSLLRRSRDKIERFLVPLGHLEENKDKPDKNKQEDTKPTDLVIAIIGL